MSRCEVECEALAAYRRECAHTVAEWSQVLTMAEDLNDWGAVRKTLDKMEVHLAEAHRRKK